MRSLLFLCVAFLSAACRSSAVSSVEGAWRSSPDQLDFGAVPLTGTGTRHLTVQNTSLAPVELLLRVDAPFEAPPSVRVEAGASLDVTVRFRPVALGEHHGTLHLGDRDVPLSGTGTAIPVCGPAGACQSSRFDPASGGCVSEPLPDGAACATACLDSAQCIAGACVGAPKSCDDGNACTLDTCDAERGCSHTDSSAQCPASTDACHVATCSPMTGCGLEAAADGTRCGDLDCTTSHVCISAVCEARPTPEGGQCRDEGPCQAASTCHNQVCVPGATTWLKERWRYQPAGRYLYFEGTVGPDGTVYFTESSLTDAAAPLELVARSKDGRELWRVELAPGCQRCSARLMLDPAGSRIIAGRRGQVQARSLATGAMLWSRDTTAGKTPRSVQPDGGASYSTSAFIGLSPDVVVEQLSEGYELHRDYSVALDRSTGNVLWERDFWGHVYFPGATSANQLWITSADCWAPITQSVLFDATGAQTGTVARSARPLTFLGDEVLLAGNDLVWASAARGAGAPLGISPGGYYLGLSEPGRLVLTDYSMVRSYGPDAGVQWSRGFDNRFVTAALLTDGGTLMAGNTADGGATLLAVDPAGVATLQCPLPGTVAAGAPMGGLWFALIRNGLQDSIVAFEAPVGELAPTGWVMPFGSASNDRRPR